MNTPAGQREQMLINFGNLFQSQLDKCKNNKDEIQKIFDNWHVWVDPNIDSAQRARTAADTNYGNQTTQFNFWFFNGDGRYGNFVHEFRHLMPANNALYQQNDNYIQDRLLGNATLHPGEKDADLFSSNFRSGNCGCGN